MLAKTPPAKTCLLTDSDSRSRNLEPAVQHLDHLPGTFFGPSTLVELLRHRARCQADNLAFTYLVDGEDEQTHLTYAELDRQARAIAAWLESRGLVGQRALLLYPAGLEFIAAFFGCLYAGVVAVPVYPPRRNRSLARIQAIADDAEAKVALTTDLVLQRVEPLIDETPHLRELTWLATSCVPEGIEERWDLPDIHGETLAFLQYTSGSTGIPKGVILNHANLVHNSALIAYAFEHTRSGTGVFWLPSYHDMGLIGGILQPMYVGRPNVLMSPMTFLQKPFRWLSAISRFRGTTSGGPNFAYELCVRKITPEQRQTLDLGSWEVAFNGAEPVREETLESFAEAFEPCGFRREAFYPCYGLAEATLIVSGGYVRRPPVIRTFEAEPLGTGRVVDAEPEDEGVRALVGCGETLRDQKIVIADPDSMTRCPEGRVGEIWVRGPSVAQGYWQDPEGTKATFHARLKDSQQGPFLRTGDLGFIQDGELYVTGRRKDLIIVHGVNHYPQDIELTVQRAHKRLRPDCGAAFSVDDGGRERMVVVQEVERRKQKDLDSVYDAVRRAVAAEHELALDEIVLIKAGSIPKTSSGKIQRHACRDGFLAGALAMVGRWTADGTQHLETVEAAATTAEEPPRGTLSVSIRSGRTAVSKNGRGKAARQRTTELVLEEIRRVGKERVAGLTLDSPIVETGLDSLERMEILASLEERFGGRFPEEILADLHTARQLVQAVEEYLGTEPRPKARHSANQEIPASAYRFDQFPEYLNLKKSLGLLDQFGIVNPFFIPHEGLTAATTTIGGRELINFSSFNYTGMSGDPVVAQAAKDAIDKYGTSVSASRLVSGEKDLHRELEQAIARFVGTEDCIVMVGGHATNETVIGHLMGPGDLILHDALAHNSIIQGSILSGARRRAFPHNDWQAADELLRQFRRDYRRVLVVIEGVYSMDGDIPELPKFIDVKDRHKALLMVDEAHSIGVLGSHGRGISEYFDSDPEQIEICMGTISKSLGNCGGFIAGRKELVEYLKYTAPGFVFSIGLPPGLAGGALAALRLMEAEPERFTRLRQNSDLFLSLAKQHGLNTGMSKDSPVVPVILGSSIECVQLSKAMFDRGINVMPILHPAVEESAARLRYFITSLHTGQQIRYTIDVMVEEISKINPEHLTSSKATAN
ncbi:MAG: aminotransferase class I/II-fold pyridoxal phosphate-dependent enzyme [Pirellulales bacterium]|nr:aminotransferase class I/II-fold pyridoxal phosphate-dependent enzyme [Pirellulales bacterium]